MFRLVWNGCKAVAPTFLGVAVALPIGELRSEGVGRFAQCFEAKTTPESPILGRENAELKHAWHFASSSLGAARLRLAVVRCLTMTTAGLVDVR